jgi:hypothetical protein
MGLNQLRMSFRKLGPIVPASILRQHKRIRPTQKTNNLLALAIIVTEEALNIATPGNWQPIEV